MHMNRTYLQVAARAAAFSAIMAGFASLLPAQQGATAAPASQPILLASSPAPIDLTAPTSSSSSSSSSSADARGDDRFNLSSAATQPPPRRRYGRPNYADSHTNPDGSNKFAFMVGAGASVPTLDTGAYLTPSYAFQAGAGRNFSKMYGLMLQFDYDHFGFTGSTLRSQANYYNNITSSTSYSNLDGTSHVWSFTLDPVISFYGSEKSGVYFTGGAGFYHKTANFTVPSTGTYCSVYGCYSYQANQTIDKYTANAVGFNGGMGFTYKPSRFAGERFYAEARYVFVDNSPRAASNSNLYPPNANQTYYIPVTVGLRF